MSVQTRPVSEQPTTGSRNPKAAGGTLQSVTRALSVLELVADSTEGLSAKRIASQLNLSLPTTYHLLNTLVRAGHVVHLAGQHRFGLGYKARYLGQALSRQLAVPPEIASAIHAVHLLADAAAYYAIYRDNEVVIAHVEDSEQRPRVQALDVGFNRAMHATALGKIMLAAMPANKRASYLDNAGTPALTSCTIHDRDELESQLSQVWNAQLAVEVDEFQNGLACMATPVRGPAGNTIASVALSLPTGEFHARRLDLECTLRQGAVRVTRCHARIAYPGESQ